MKIAKVVIGVCAAALLMSGCMTEEPIKQRASDERIKLVENSSFTLELLSARTMINDEGLLTVDASALLGRTGYFRWVFSGDPKVTVWYHFDWIDSQGNICPPVQREMSALPGNILDFHGVAPAEKYINYHLSISLKGPEANDDVSKKKTAKMKKIYVKSGKVKPAGKSRAKQIDKTKIQKNSPKKSAAAPAAKQTAPAAGPAVKKPAEHSKAESGTAPQKLTEPFN